MKPITLFISGILFSLGMRAQVPAQKLYLNLNSHNETSDGAYDGSTNAFYMTYYAKVKELADSVISKKACWNFQSDFKFLLGALKWDPKTLNNTVSGSNLNLIKWMDDSYYIECDPHSHEGTNFGKQLTYADVAHLHDSLGCTNRKNVGGFKWDGLQNGSYSAGVHNDLNSYGCWKPGGNVTGTFFTHVNTRRVRNQGNGCELHLTDTTVDSRITTNLRNYATKVANGTFPAGNFYTQSIQIDVRDFNKTNFINRVCAVLDTANKLVAEGKAVWATISQKDSIWLHQLDSMAFINDCNTVLSTAGINSFVRSGDVKLFPSPAINSVNLQVATTDKMDLKIVNAQGQVVKNNILSGTTNYEIDVKDLPDGVYLVVLLDQTGNTISRKLIVQ